ncbi:hypothetical protein ELG88_08400 [Rhizobium leguminosarum]|uniref:hypothetical protein n=1 Tax=Rhizobium leguminosarum TaxID=384 RepID=UPI00102F8655|nr:hypothetical protein [Rhizobium leguminosarum]TBF35234.1 hypothetical protein ELG88_08400 [Rhizobium leguminosarum]
MDTPEPARTVGPNLAVAISRIVDGAAPDGSAPFHRWEGRGHFAHLLVDHGTAMILGFRVAALLPELDQPAL